MSLSVVVTGASGFLGSVLVRQLKAKGIETIAVARRPIKDGVQVADYTQAPVGDVLIHLAADSDRARAQAAKDCYVEETEQILKGLLAKPYKKVIYASSAVLYGDQSAEPHHPDDPVSFNDAYSRAKYEGEKLTLGSGRGVVVRLTNLFGPGMASGNVLSTILRQAREKDGTPLKVWDDSPVRDFLWVEDAARALVLMAEQIVAKEGARAIYNLGSGIGVSVRDLALLALDLSGQPERAIEVSRPTFGSSTLVLDSTATMADFGWRPQTDLKTGLSVLLASS